MDSCNVTAAAAEDSAMTNQLEGVVRSRKNWLATNAG